MLDPVKTDLQLYRGLNGDDHWVDAGLPELFLYLYDAHHSKVPDAWEPAMRDMKATMKGLATRQHIYMFVDWP